MAENEILAAVQLVLDRSYDGDTRIAALEGSAEDGGLWSRAVEQGWFALAAPESADGFDIPLGELVPIFRLFGERLAVGPWLEQMLLPGLLLKAVCAEDQAADRLSGALHGEARLALVDGGSTFDWRDGQGAPKMAEAVLTGGNEIVRFGTKADLFVVIVEQEASAVLLIDAARQKIRTRSRESADPGTAVASVYFDAVMIDKADVLVEGAAAESLIRAMRAWVRILASAELTGISRTMLDLAVEYIGQREQFGRSVSTFQAVKHLAAEMAQQVLTLEAMCEAVRVDSDHQQADLQLTALALKQVASEVGREVTENALQLHGGIGFTYEYILHWYYKRALALRTFFGDDRECAVEVGRLRLVGMNPVPSFVN